MTDKERLISKPKISATRILPPDEGTNNTNDFTKQRMFTVEEAAAYFVYLGATGVTHWTVRGLIKSGQLIYEPIGRRFYVSRSSIDDYISKRERRAKP